MVKKKVIKRRLTERNSCGLSFVASIRKGITINIKIYVG